MTTDGILMIKWLWAAVFAPLLWKLWNKIEQVDKNAITRQEVREQIDLKVEPLVQEQGNQERRLTKQIDKLATSVNTLTSVVTEFRVEVASFTRQRERDND